MPFESSKPFRMKLRQMTVSDVRGRLVHIDNLWNVSRRTSGWIICQISFKMSKTLSIFYCFIFRLVLLIIPQSDFFLFLVWYFMYTCTLVSVWLMYTLNCVLRYVCSYQCYEYVWGNKLVLRFAVGPILLIYYWRLLVTPLVWVQCVWLKWKIQNWTELTWKRLWMFGHHSA